jgi:hypothetical protein
MDRLKHKTTQERNNFDTKQEAGKHHNVKTESAGLGFYEIGEAKGPT